LRHKDTNAVILLDTKNNLPTNPVVSTAEFERDVLRKETAAIGGIMLANGSISCKKKFEINRLQQKCLVYVSEFERNNIAYLFSLLDMIVEMSRGGGGSGCSGSGNDISSDAVDASQTKEALRTLLITDYKREQSNLENVERMRKSTQKTIDAIIAEFDTHFVGEDIEMAAKSDEIGVSSTRIKQKTSTDIIDYDALENGRDVIGQRSKYYFEYGTKIQYFKNNYARNLKMKSIHPENGPCPPTNPKNGPSNIIISVNTSKMTK
jgi:hypothetical protein